MKRLDPRVKKTEKIENEFDSRRCDSLGGVSSKSLDSLGWVGS